MKHSIYLVLLISKLVISFQIETASNDGSKSQTVPEFQSRTEQYPDELLPDDIIGPISHTNIHNTILQSSQVEDINFLISTVSSPKHVFQTALHTKTVTGITKSVDRHSPVLTTRERSNKITTILPTSFVKSIGEEDDDVQKELVSEIAPFNNVKRLTKNISIENKNEQTSVNNSHFNENTPETSLINNTFEKHKISESKFEENIKDDTDKSHPLENNKAGNRTINNYPIDQHKNKDSQIKFRLFEDPKHIVIQNDSLSFNESIQENTTLKIFGETKSSSLGNRSFEGKSIITGSTNSRNSKEIDFSSNIENTPSKTFLPNNQNNSAQPTNHGVNVFQGVQLAIEKSDRIIFELNDTMIKSAMSSINQPLNNVNKGLLNVSNTESDIKSNLTTTKVFEIDITNDLNTKILDPNMVTGGVLTKLTESKIGPGQMVNISESFVFEKNIGTNETTVKPTISNDMINPVTLPFYEYSDISESILHDPIHSSKIDIQPIHVAEHEDIVLIESIKIRKCCHANQFFNTNSFSCENEKNIPFITHTRILMYGFHPTTVEIDPGLLQTCIYTHEQPAVENDVTNSTFILLPTGELYDFFTEVSFNSSEYCLELVGEEIQSSSLTLIYCPEIVQNFPEYSDYELDLDNTSHAVRKCCNENQYYNVNDNKCLYLNDTDHFNSEIQAMTFSRNTVELTFLTGSLTRCVNKELPTISPVTFNMIRLKPNGEIIHVPTGIHYNVSHYCLELIGSQLDELSLTIALCPESYVVPKCCPFGYYFDENRLDCITYPHQHMLENNTLLNHFRKDVETYNLSPSMNFLACERSFPVEESADQLILHEGLLCNHASCFNEIDYCVEFIGKRVNELKPSAFYCEQKIFIKCCLENQILSKEGCIEHEGGNSVLLRQLMKSRSFRRNFDSKRCIRGPGILLDDTYADYIKWSVSENGLFLNVRSDSEDLKIEHYCVDDYIDSEEGIAPGALVCEDEVSHMIPNEHNFFHYLDGGSLGKCCPQNRREGYVQYLSPETNKCDVLPSNQTLTEDIFLTIANISDEHFHDFPQCNTENVFYHSFTFKPGDYDYVRMTADRTMQLVTKVGRCISNEKIISNKDMCVEFVLNKDGQIYPAAFICAYSTIAPVYTEKYILITVLLGISCFCLILTLISLFTMRVRRGMVTVRKVNTLAGRILVSFVSSQLIGILSFVLTQHDNEIIRGLSENISCYILAGFIEFFNLAAFCWNTSICLESLLLTIHVSVTSESIKYFFHSLWAWGFPLFMTVLMFLMDYYQDQLPCWIVTPQLATDNCFFPKTDHKPFLLYFYLPIFITLVANVLFLVGAKLMRKARLNRLEKGRKKVFTEPIGQSSAEGHQVRTGGMRTHQNQNTKVESIRIVVWTGGLWFLECLGYVVTRFVLDVVTEERWYDYLWYVPTCLNALRGVGIFAIIVLTPEKRKELSISHGRFKQRFFSQLDKPSTRKHRGNNSSISADYSSKRFTYNNNKSRNMSVTTVITTLSSSIYMGTKFEDDNTRKASIASFISTRINNIRKKSSIGGSDSPNKLSVNNSNNNRPRRKIGMIRSISQIDRRLSTASYTGSFLEELEMKEDSVRRKYSMNPSSLQLPKLQEEDSSFEDDTKQRFKEDSSFKTAGETAVDESLDVNMAEQKISCTKHNAQAILNDPASECNIEDSSQKTTSSPNQVICLNDLPSVAEDSEITLTELDIDLEPLELDVPIKFPFRITFYDAKDAREPNLKKFSATSWTDIDLQLPESDDESSPIDV